jgi:hypothetical protein
MPTKNTVLDVRPDLAAGREPLSKIMDAAREIPDLGSLTVLAPFEPVPLYSVLRRMGFSHETEALGAEGYRIVFTRTADSPGES